MKNFIINERRRRNERGNGKQKRCNQGSNGSNVVIQTRANGTTQSYPNSQTSSSTVQPNPSENELGPELSRLFSGLATPSHKIGSEYTPEVSKISRTTESSSDDSSIESPVRTRAQLSPSRQSATPVLPSEERPLRARPSRHAMNGAMSHYVVSDPHPPTQQTALSHSKPVASRKASGTADISPYLSSKTELPVSAKTLQHLHLLETVADESARMAPILAARAALVNQGVPPLPNSHDLIYCSNPPSNMSYPNHLPTGNTPATLNQQGSFQLRSRTSQSFNRPIAHNHTGSMTLHQNHLLAVINGARSVPVTPNYPFLQQPQPPLPPAQPHNPSYFPSTAPLHSYMPVTYNSISGTGSAFVHASRHPMPAPIPAPTSNSVSQLAHAPSVIIDSNPGINMAPSVPNPLLSILNGRPA